MWCKDTIATLGTAGSGCVAGAKPATQQTCAIPLCSTNNLIATFSVAGSYGWTFTSATTSYNPVRVPNGQTSASAVATLQDATATLTWGPQSVSGLVPFATQNIACTVTAQNGATRAYTFSVLRDPSANNYLSSATVAGSYGWTFISTTTSYSPVSVPNAQTSASVVATPQDGTASVSCAP